MRIIFFIRSGRKSFYLLIVISCIWTNNVKSQQRECGVVQIISPFEDDSLLCEEINRHDTVVVIMKGSLDYSVTSELMKIIYLEKEKFNVKTYLSDTASIRKSGFAKQSNSIAIPRNSKLDSIFRRSIRNIKKTNWRALETKGMLTPLGLSLYETIILCKVKNTTYWFRYNYGDSKRGAIFKTRKEVVASIEKEFTH